jgi:hypothetical protein
MIFLEDIYKFDSEHFSGNNIIFHLAMFILQHCPPQKRFIFGIRESDYSFLPFYRQGMHLHSAAVSRRYCWLSPPGIARDERRGIPPTSTTVGSDQSNSFDPTHQIANRNATRDFNEFVSGNGRGFALQTTSGVCEGKLATVARRRVPGSGALCRLSRESKHGQTARSYGTNQFLESED